MRFRSYMRDHLLGLVLWAIVTVFTVFFLNAVGVPGDALVYTEILFGAVFWVPFIAGYVQRAHWWNTTMKLTDQLEHKYRLPATMEDPTFADAEVASEVLERMAQNMSDEVAHHERERRAYREYLERWIHEVKTPIASAKLVAHNHPGPEMRQIMRDLDRIEGRVMQALYYARGSAVEKDYFVEQTTLGTLVDAALRRNSRELIAAKFRIEKPDLDESVYTDPKWLGFVLDQIIQNAVKYRSGDDGVLRFAARQTGSSVELLIEDEGIGAEDSDLGRVFEKGFTGSTGRRYGASTGMGLYISAQLLEKMNHSIRAGHGSSGGFLITIHFPKGPMHLLSK